MRLSKITPLLAACALTAIQSATFAGIAPAYQFQDLGDLGGSKAIQAMTMQNYARSISDTNIVAGEAYDASGNTFVYRETVFDGSLPTNSNDLYAVGANSVDDTGWDVNNAGVIVGRTAVGPNNISDDEAYRFNVDGTAQFLAAPSVIGSRASAINDSERISGMIVSQVGRSIQFLPGYWDGGSFTVVPAIDPSSSFQWGAAFDVNEAGQVTGQAASGAGFRAFVADASGTSAVTLQAANDTNNNSQANAINDDGEVVGWVDNMWIGNAGARVPFIWTPDTANGLTSSIDVVAMSQTAANAMAAANGFGSYSTGMAMSISNDGLVVGYLNVSTIGSEHGKGQINTTQWPIYFASTTFVGGYDAFIWNHLTQEVVDLQDLLVGAGEDVDLIAAVDINNGGNILVHYTIDGTTVRSAMLTPIPEPSTGLLLGLALLGGCKRLRKVS